MTNLSDFKQTRSYTYFPVARMMGSLPDGNVVPDTPVYAVEGLEGVFDPKHMLPDQAFHEIDLQGQLAFYIDDVALPDETEVLISLSEQLGFRNEAPGIQTPPGMRQNKSVHWLAEDAVLAPIFNRIQPFLPPILEGRGLINRLSNRINMYRYDDQDVFNLHIDGDWPGYELSADGRAMKEWPVGYSMLTMLLYLNGHEEGIEGGETHLYAKGALAASIPPKKGRALFFRHGHTSGSVLHAGAQVTGPISKYVARINVMYR